MAEEGRAVGEKLDLSAQPTPPHLVVPELEQAIRWVDAALKNECHLPADAPYRSIPHLWRVVLNAAGQLLVTVTPSAPPGPDIPWETALEIYLSRLAGIAPETNLVADVLFHLGAAVPDLDLADYKRVPYGKELSQRRGFLVELIRGDPPDTHVDAFWFGIFSPIREGRGAFDAYIWGGDFYRPNDPQWPHTTKWRPGAGYLHSKSLQRLWRLGHRAGGSPNVSELLSLAFVTEAARVMATNLEDGTSLRVEGVCVGFDWGEPIDIPLI